MEYMKLKEFCDIKSISYITGWRWFNNGQIPGAYRTDSGTILVPKDIPEEKVSNDAMSVFLKKTVEFSKGGSTIEDFAAYVLSNFQLKLNSPVPTKGGKDQLKAEEALKHIEKYLPRPEEAERLKAVHESAVKTKKQAEATQKHLLKFQPPQEEVEKLKAVKDALVAGQPIGDVVPASNFGDDDLGVDIGELSSTLDSYMRAIPTSTNSVNEDMRNIAQTIAVQNAINAADYLPVGISETPYATLATSTDLLGSGWVGDAEPSAAANCCFNTQDAYYGSLSSDASLGSFTRSAITASNCAAPPQITYFVSQTEQPVSDDVIETKNVVRRRGRKPTKIIGNNK